MSLVMHTVEERISTFFAKYCLASQADCNALAEKITKSAISVASPQGAFSYTVCGGGYVVQFRATRSPLDVKMLEFAKTVHGTLVPRVTSFGNLLEDARITVYRMEMLRGINYSRLDLSRSLDNKTELVCKQARTMESLAKFFIQSWNNRVDIQPSTIDTELTSHQSKLEALRRSLPSKFKPLLSYCLYNIHHAFRGDIPWTLTHGDLCDTNIMVDPATGELTGVIDWAEATVLPFGFALWGMETFLGYIDVTRGQTCWKYHGERGYLETVFWETFHAEVGPLSNRQCEAITTSRLVGLFIRHGFKFNGLELVAKDESWDLGLLDGQLMGGSGWVPTKLENGPRN